MVLCSVLISVYFCFVTNWSKIEYVLCLFVYCSVWWSISRPFLSMKKKPCLIFSIWWNVMETSSTKRMEAVSMGQKDNNSDYQELKKWWTSYRFCTYLYTFFCITVHYVIKFWFSCLFTFISSKSCINNK